MDLPNRIKLAVRLHVQVLHRVLLIVHLGECLGLCRLQLYRERRDCTAAAPCLKLGVDQGAEGNAKLCSDLNSCTYQPLGCKTRFDAQKSDFKNEKLPVGKPIGAFLGSNTAKTAYIV